MCLFVQRHLTSVLQYFLTDLTSVRPFARVNETVLPKAMLRREISFTSKAFEILLKIVV